MSMTRASRRNSSLPGFTIIEILVVVAIIVVLMAIIIPATSHVKASAARSAELAHLNAIQTGLQQYYADFGLYPSSTTPAYASSPTPIAAGRGPEILAQALMGYLPSDVDGGGPRTTSGASSTPTDSPYAFRTRQSSMGGKPYGPYVPADEGYSRADPTKHEFFIDRWNGEILYYHRSTVKAPTKLFDTAAAADSFFITDDNTKLFDPANLIPDVTVLPGNPDDIHSRIDFFKKIYSSVTTPYPPKPISPDPNTYAGGIVTGSDSYLLISAGADGKYFTDDDLVVGKN
jgi:prepilin-type N-terminal cleavage/methylation domain-containing protein